LPAAAYAWIPQSSHGGLELHSSILSGRYIAVDPQHVVIRRFLQGNGVVTALSADSGEEVASNVFIAVTSFGECEDVGDFKVLLESC
jgi:hypothetical protein